MKLKIKPKELREVQCFKHRKVADGYSYEADVYTIPIETEVELNSNNTEHICFSEPIKEITVQRWLTDCYITMKFKLINNSTVTINSKSVDYEITLDMNEEDVVKHLVKKGWENIMENKKRKNKGGQLIEDD